MSWTNISLIGILCERNLQTKQQMPPQSINKDKEEA
jgi:hypothetical protein